MDEPTPPNAHTNRQEHRKDRPMSGRIAAFLTIVRALLGFGQHLDKTLPAQIDHPRLSHTSCGGAFWQEIYLAITNFGGDFHQFHEVQTRRREAFQTERAKRPDTWNWQLWDKPQDAIRQMLGFLLGEPNATALSG